MTARSSATTTTASPVVKAQVEDIFSKHPAELRRPVAVRPGWYYDTSVVTP